MALEIVRGAIRNNLAVHELRESLQAILDNGTLYFGYPVIASADASFTIEALLVSEDYGLVAFTFPEAGEDLKKTKEDQDLVFYLLEGNLRKHESLRCGREIAVKPNVITYYPSDQ